MFCLLVLVYAPTITRGVPAAVFSSDTMAKLLILRSLFLFIQLLGMANNAHAGSGNTCQTRTGARFSARANMPSALLPRDIVAYRTFHVFELNPSNSQLFQGVSQLTFNCFQLATVGTIIAE